MRKNTLLLLALFGTITSFAQDKEKDDSESGVRHSNWILEAHVGNIKGVKPYNENYFSSKPNGVFGQWEPNSFSIGARYLVGEIFSVKGSLGYDRFRNYNAQSLQTGADALPFDMRQYNVQIQGFANGAKLFNAYQQLGRWNFLFHGGIQVVAMTSKTENYWNLQTGELENHNFNQTEWNGGLIFGVTPEYRVTKRLALQLDVTMVHNYRQHFNWDGSYADDRENLSGQTISLNFGVSFSLDKNTIHGDWFVIDKSEDAKYKELEKRVVDMEEMLKDMDKDGVPDYKDQENNSVAGVAVDARGKMLDINKNGVADEMEKGKDGMNGINSSTMSKEDAIKLFVEKGYVNIFYDYDKDVPNAGSVNNVFYIVKFLKNYPDSRMTLMGFADERGTAEYNADLTTRRVKNLSDIIKASGIDMSRITVVGKGETNEFISTELGYDLSRRVSVKLE
jgi:OOP family OmpA-OmpF porin